MSNYGSDISRTLPISNRGFKNVLFRKSKPPLDAEYNLQDDICSEEQRKLIQSEFPSGFFLDPTNPMNDFQFDPSWSNMFVLGNPRKRVSGQTTIIEQSPVINANVNGWIVPVAGTDIYNAWTGGEPTNIVRLYPPPESDARTDFIFLEVWQTRIDANPATANKPAKDKIWKYGNVKFGGTNLSDDLEDPAIGYSTTARVQIQYRVRVFGSGVGQGMSADLINYPDGLGYPNILGQGTATSPVGGLYFTNMRETLGDPSLWRAGDGNTSNGLGTVDGYTYAIPICAIFRRNSRSYMAVPDSGNPNHNGAFNRTPTTSMLADPLTGAKVLTTCTLKNEMKASDGFSPTGFPITPGPVSIAFPYGYPVSFTFQVNNIIGSGLDDIAHNWNNTYIVIDNEIIGVSSVDSVNGTITVPEWGRGRNNTGITGHNVGSTISFFNTRPDNLYADQIAVTDVLDLRRAINANDWDYGRLLEHNVGTLISGKLHTSWKREGAPYGNTQGVVINEVSELYAYDNTYPNGTVPVDGPDGVRTVWSDGATPQPDITNLLDNNSDTSGPTPQKVESFDATIEWDVSPGFKPSGFLNTAQLTNKASFSNGSVLLFHIGGEDGGGGARGTFRDGDTRAVRFLMPKEMWKTNYPDVNPTSGNQYPIRMRFWGQGAHEPPPDHLDSTLAARHVGPMYPWKDISFEYPFIALGGILKTGTPPSLMRTTVLSSSFSNNSDHDSAFVDWTIVNLDLAGWDFDDPGVFYSKDANGNFSTDPNDVALPLLRGTQTLYGLLTDEGRDRTGMSSELYLTIYGETIWRHCNGAFQVIGVGTVGYTTNNAPNATSLVLRPLSADFVAINPGPNYDPVMVEFRTPYHNSDDTSNSVDRTADLAVVLTDLGGILNKSLDVGGMTITSSDHPWKRDHLGYGTTYDLSTSFEGNYAYLEAKCLVDLTLLYHPGRGAMARVPDELCRFALKGASDITNGAYLRQGAASIDTTFSATSGMPSNEIVWNPAHAQLWNRLSGYGWDAPMAPSYGGNVIGFTEQDRESELFYDRGSKSIIFRPFRSRQMTLQSINIQLNAGGTAFPAGYNLEGPILYPSAIAKDPWPIFTPNKYMTYPVPKEFMPRFGRQDIPYYTDINSGNGPFLPGINHLFVDTTNALSGVFNIIGGEPELTSIKTLIFRTDHPELYAQFGTYTGIENARPCVYARKTTAVNVPPTTYGPEVKAKLAAVNSSDFGKGLQGVQLPPYLGPARVLGVYEQQDFEAAGGHTFQSNRWQMETNAPPNLLRTDASKQTLFILQDGAKDLTNSADDHTYIIPSNAIDVTRSKHYVSGTSFDSYQYVVECTIFGFAKGFINKNNYALVRQFNGHSRTNSDGDDTELNDIYMTIPCPAGDSHHLYADYNRTVYQGDPYFSRTGSDADYTTRYGQISIPDQYDLRIPIQQFDVNGHFVPPLPNNFIPEIANPKSFEVLASMDFYTTLGTGKMGGTLYAGTPLDVGYTETNEWSAVRMPQENTSPDWRIWPRAYSEGQKTNPNRAKMTIICQDNDSWCIQDPTDVYSMIRFRFRLLDGTDVDLYGVTPTLKSTIQALFSPPLPDANTFLVDENSTEVMFEPITYPAAHAVPYAGFYDFVITDAGLTGATIGDAVIVNPLNTSPSETCSMFGWVSAAGQVTVRVLYPANSPFSWPIGAANQLTRTISFLAGDAPGLVSVPANSSATVGTFAFNGALPADTVLIEDHTVTTTPAFNLIMTARIDSTGLVTIVAHNVSTAPITVGARTMYVTVLRNASFAAATVFCPRVQVRHRVGSMAATIQNLVATINNNDQLYNSVKALSAGDHQFELISVPVGAEGNGIRVASSYYEIDNTAIPPNPQVTIYSAQKFAYMRDAIPANDHPLPFVTSAEAPLYGGTDIPMNGGNGTSQVGLTGMTERLPLGALLQDSDFICENPLSDEASACKSSPIGPHPIQTLMPMTQAGEEFERFIGTPGQLLALSDGFSCINSFGSYTDLNPTGTRRFRMFRGGGSAFVLSGDNPGGPVDWVSDSFPAASLPILKGGILTCRAMLVRNFSEPYGLNGSTTYPSQGDEIQMVVTTYGILGNGMSREQGVTLDGTVSPSGYGEGYAATDRFRIDGRPMFRTGQTRQVPDPSTVQLAVYPDSLRDPEHH